MSNSDYKTYRYKEKCKITNLDYQNSIVVMIPIDETIVLHYQYDNFDECIFNFKPDISGISIFIDFL